MSSYEEEQLELRKMQVKYSSMYYSLPDTYKEKNEAYTKAFNAGEGLIVGFDTFIYRTHRLEGKIDIGSKVTLGNHVTIDYSGYVKIGNNVHIAEGTKIYSHKHPNYNIMKNEKSSFEAIPEETVIGDNVVIDAGAIIYPGVKIGDNAVVYAGAVVIEDVEPYGVVIGNPAMDIREYVKLRKMISKKGSAK